MSMRHRQVGDGTRYRTHANGYFHVRANYANCEATMFTPTQLNKIFYLDQWLDGNVGPAYQQAPLAQDLARIAKIGEETGEAIQAFIGLTGQNPRKGVHGTMNDLLEELADCAVTAILAIQHFTKDTSKTNRILTSTLDATYHRAIKTER